MPLGGDGWADVWKRHHFAWEDKGQRAAISILADNMADGAVRSGERIVQYGERIRAYGERLTEIVDRTSRVAAMDTPMRPYRLAAVDVTEVAREAFEEARRASKKRDSRRNAPSPKACRPCGRTRRPCGKS